MRVLRVVLGILTLLLALPVLAAGAVGWWAMQHRSPDGAFHADLAPITAESRVLVIPDVDAVLRRDVPFARADETELHLSAGDGTFVGMAVPADLAVYLTGVSYTEISGISLGRGQLVTKSRVVPAMGGQLAEPPPSSFWVRGREGELGWSPTTDRDRHIALVVIAPPGDAPIRLSVALTAGWLNSTTWGLLILGPVLLLLGLAAIAWPQRPREIVYVVDSPAAPAPPIPSTRPFPQARLAPEPADPPRFFATAVGWRASAPLPTQPRFHPEPPAPDLAWPFEEAPTTTEPSREIITQELPLVGQERPMPTAGMQLHLANPQ